MGQLAVPLLIASTAVSAVGTIASGHAAEQQGLAQQQQMIAEGQAKKKAMDFEAAQLDIQAKNEFALGQREAQQFKRQKDLALSRSTAVSAASGFTATDPTALANADEITRYGTLQEQMAMFGGGSKAEELRLSAAGRRFSGDSALQSAYASGEAAATAGRNARNASYFSAGGTILGSLSGMAGKYGGTSKGFTPYRNSGGALVINQYGSRYG